MCELALGQTRKAALPSLVLALQLQGASYEANLILLTSLTGKMVVNFDCLEVKTQCIRANRTGLGVEDSDRKHTLLAAEHALWLHDMDHVI